MVTAVIYFDTSNPDGFVSALDTTGELFEDVQGFHGFNLMRGVEDPNRFLLLVEWDSVENHQAWQRSHVDQFLGKLNPHLSSPPDIKHFK